MRRIGYRLFRRSTGLRVTGFVLALPLVLATGRAAFFRGPILPPEPLPNAPLIDIHCHVAGIGKGASGCYLSPRLLKSWKFRFYLRGFGLSPHAIEESGDKICADRVAETLAASEHVNCAVLLAMDAAVDADGLADLKRTEFYVPNEFVLSAVHNHSNLLFGASINPYRPDALQRLDSAATNGACLVKWLPSIQLIDPSDERLIPFYNRLAELHLPLLVHTGNEHSFTWARNEFGDPERLRLPLKQGVTIIAAHAAWPGKHNGERDIDRLARLMDAYPNLYADISSLTQINKLGALRHVLKRPEFRQRLVYGTDYPLSNMPIVSPWFFLLDLKFSECRRINRIRNPWDRDVALKQALGVPANVFTRADKILCLNH
jgi:hypothetical protein